jgi:hypothetical protein
MHKHAKEMAKIDSSTGRLCPRSTQSGSCLDRGSSVPIIPNKFQNLQNILTFLEEFDCLNRILQKMTQINVCSKMKVIFVRYRKFFLYNIKLLKKSSATAATSASLTFV